MFIHVSGKKKKTNCFTYLLELNLKMGNGGDQVILATGGYDHSIKFWQAHSGVCQRTVQHPDSVSYPHIFHNIPVNTNDFQN